MSYVERARQHGLPRAQNHNAKLAFKDRVFVVIYATLACSVMVGWISFLGWLAWRFLI
jgi:hypothetical protein